MVRIDDAELRRFVAALFVAAGTPRDIADDVAESLVAADLAGHHSHGARLVDTYTGRIEDGRVVPDNRPEVVKEDSSSAQIDGCTAFGQIVGRKAVDVGVSKTKQSTVSVVGMRDSTHLGRVGEWAERAIAQDLAFVGFTCNPWSTHVAPPGSAEGRLSTNPITIGLPSFGAVDHPLVVDIATSQVAFGKIKERFTAGEPVPDEWAGEYEGKPDAGPMMVDGTGSLLPLGGSISGYKGFGLAVMGELLAGSISDGIVSGQPNMKHGNEAVFFLVDPLKFTTKNAITDRVTQLKEYVLSAEPHPDMSIGIAAKGDELLMPGESEQQNRADQLEHGVFIPEGDVGLLRSVAERYDVTDSIPDAFAVSP